MPTFVKRSMAGGELAPSLHARADTVKYQTGLATCRNFIVKRSGGIATRPGTLFVGPAKYNNRRVRLIPFVFSSTQSYVIELGHQYLRVITNGGYLLESVVLDIDSITRASPAVVTTSVGHGWADDDLLLIYQAPALDGMGMVQMDGRYVRVSNPAGADFDAQDPYGTDIDSSSYTPYVAGNGFVQKVLELTTTYDEDDLFDITYAQSADVMTLCHADYPVKILSRTGAASWTFGNKIFGTSIATPSAGPSARYPDTTSTSGEATGVKIAATAVGHNGEESLAATLSLTRPVDDDSLIIDNKSPDASGQFTLETFSTNLFNRKGVLWPWTSTANTYTVEGISQDGTTQSESIVTAGIGAKVSTLSYWRKITNVQTQDGTASGGAISFGVIGDPSWFKMDISLAYTGSAGTFREFRIYRGLLNSLSMGFVGSVAGDQASPVIYTVENTIPDYLVSPPFDPEFFGDTATDPGGSTDKRPGVVAFYQQRLILAGSNDAPETVWMSRTGLYDNFLISTPIQDDNAISFVPANQRVARVRHMLDLGRLIIFTTEGELVVEGDAAGIVTPNNINVRKFSYNGIGSLPPLPIGSNALYVQARGNQIRDLSYSFEIDGYRGNDLTIFASHLFDRYQVVDWTYQRIPDSIIWAVRSDGVMLGLTYLQDHEIYGWHQHDSRPGLVYSVSDGEEYVSGTFKSVCSIPGDLMDDVYLAVFRQEGPEGQGVYIEQMANRYQTSIGAYVCADSCVVIDGTNRNRRILMWMDAAAWTVGSAVTVRLVLGSGETDGFYHPNGSTGARLEATDQVRITKGGVSILIVITGSVTNTSAVGQLGETVPAEAQTATAADAVSDWGVRKRAVRGLHHLNGAGVSFQSDGYVIANPNDSSIIAMTVMGGAVSAATRYGEQLHAGLPFVSDAKTLDLDMQDMAIVDQRKLVTKVTLSLEQTAKLYVGADAPSDDTVDLLEDLSPIDVDEEAGSGGPADAQYRLRDTSEDVIIASQWNARGRVFIRNIDPLPATILGIYPQALTAPRGGQRRG